MMQTIDQNPVVVTLSCNDPTGGSGLHADIETLASVGCHAAPVVTAISIQDTNEIKDISLLPTPLVLDQLSMILSDMPVAAIKIGFLGDMSSIQGVAKILSDYPVTPIVLDPSVTTLHQRHWRESELFDLLKIMIFPLVSVCTLNAPEALSLAPSADSLEAAAQELMEYGIGHCLITDCKQIHQLNSPKATHRVFGHHRLIEEYSTERLPYQCYGAGCTLSASIAGFMAQGLDVVPAIHEGHLFTEAALKRAYRAGMGKLIPNRLFWANANTPNRRTN